MSLGSDLSERFTAGVDRGPPGQALPARDGGVDMAQIEFDRIAASSRALGRKDGRAAAAKGIKHDVAATGNVANGVRDHRDRLDGRMEVEAARSAAPGKGVHAWIVPDVRPVAPMPAQLDVVDPLCAPPREDEDKLVSRTVERPHAAVGLDPYTEVQEHAACRLDRADGFGDVPPVHAGEEGPPVSRMGDHQAERDFEKVAERGFSKIARSHRKLSVLPRALSRHMPLDSYVVRRVGKDSGGLLFAEKRGIGRRFEGAPAEEAMLVQVPKVAKSGYLWPVRGLEFVGWVGCVFGRLERLNAQIDFGRFEPRRLNL